ncbi:MAG: TlyA family RNA methyltransferase [bacterium]|jgi:23S rRNA (cytidine1920-2'-O)/16S rRNA (cytidine1409-2'-O)-methyltransferase
MTQKRERLDTLLVRLGYFPSREKAQAAVMAGLVDVEDRCTVKAGEKIAADSKITVRGDPVPYVSRGGLKLARALEQFAVPVAGKVILDVGASTGGFTDCLLQNGAAKVYAVDVGYGQLAWSLRQDPRVINLERTNIRYLKAEELPERPDIAVIDVSFISLTKVLPVVRELLSPAGRIIALVKPQFEAGRENVGKKGVVRDPAVHSAVLTSICRFARENGFGVVDLTFSPLKGPQGNIEFFLHLSVTSDPAADDVVPERLIRSVVNTAHAAVT